MTTAIRTNADPHAAAARHALDSVLAGPAHTAATLRQAVSRNEGVPADLAPLVAKIHQHAYRVTDEDMAAAQSIHGDDRMFEIVVSAAIGASRIRLEAGLAALEEA